jgi:sec-independent protein translocase protein TatA
MNFLNIGFLELLMILVLALILFGPQRLLTLGSALRKAFIEFQRQASDLASAALEQQDAPAPPSPEEQRAEFVPEKPPEEGGTADQDQESPPPDR